jgi:hypothetical protein
MALAILRGLGDSNITFPSLILISQRTISVSLFTYLNCVSKGGETHIRKVVRDGELQSFNIEEAKRTKGHDFPPPVHVVRHNMSSSAYEGAPFYVRTKRPTLDIDTLSEMSSVSKLAANVASAKSKLWNRAKSLNQQQPD